MDKTAKPQESGKRAAAAKPAEPKTDRKQTPKAQRGSNAGRSPARKPNRTEEKRASLQHQAIRLAKKGKSKAKSILKSVAVATRTQTKALQIRSIITSKGPQAEQQNKENIQQLAGGRGPVARKGGKPTLLDEIRYKIEKNKFLFEELVKRDFKKKYKRTSLGMLWSVLNPLLTLLVMSLVFTQFFGRTMPHYTIYLFSGNLLFSYYRESTTGGMSALVSNAGIFSKVNIPKYMFVLSRNVSSLLNFALTLLVYFFFVIMDGLPITPRFLYLLYPIVCMVVFNIGMGLILSALEVFFRDTRYLYDIGTLLLMYLSAIFYSVDNFPENIQQLFLLNPVYVYIKFFRVIVIDGNLPSPLFHILAISYALLAVTVGGLIYKKFNNRFLYYL